MRSLYTICMLLLALGAVPALSVHAQDATPTITPTLTPIPAVSPGLSNVMSDTAQLAADQQLLWMPGAASGPLWGIGMLCLVFGLLVVIRAWVERSSSE